MEFERSKKVNIQLNIVPLIDVIFLVLLFFILSWQYVNQPGIKITLPKTQTAKTHLDNIVIFISKDNEIYLGDKKVDVFSLKEVLEKKLKNSGQKSVTLRADEKINLGLAVKVMDIAKQAEAEELIISTKLEENVR